MTKLIDSDALGTLTKSLGLSGAGAPETELDDGTVHQTLDITGSVRRGRSLAGSDGMFVFMLLNTHVAPGTLLTSFYPYNADRFADGIAQPPYPAPMPAQFDVWLLGASMTRFEAVGNLIEASLLLRGIQPAGGVSGLSTPVTVTGTSFYVARWPGPIIDTLNGDYAPLGDLTIFRKIGVRIPRLAPAAAGQAEIRFESNTDLVGTVNFACIVLIGVFPIGLGQDGIT